MAAVKFGGLIAAPLKDTPGFPAMVAQGSPSVTRPAAWTQG